MSHICRHPQLLISFNVLISRASWKTDFILFCVTHNVFSVSAGDVGAVSVTPIVEAPDGGRVA